MKQLRINGPENSPLIFRMVMSGVCVALVLSGCISAANSPTPRFYGLQAVEEGKVQPVRGCDFNSPGSASGGAGKKINIASGTLIGVGPVKIPEYQNRPQIVTRDKEGMLKFAQFDRWGESLDLGMARLIETELSAMFPEGRFALYPWDPSITVKYQVAVEIVQLDSELDKDMFLVAQWLVIDAKNRETVVIRRSEFKLPVIPRNYSGLAKTLSTACASLSGEIAEALDVLETKDDAAVSGK